VKEGPLTTTTPGQQSKPIRLLRLLEEAEVTQLVRGRLDLQRLDGSNGEAPAVSMYACQVQKAGRGVERLGR
jgi:hypothetical protein